MLLDVEVAGEPGEVVPVAHLVIHLRPSRLLRLGPAAAAVIIGQQGGDLTDLAIVEPGDRFAKSSVVAQAETRDDGQAFRSLPDCRFRARSGRRAHRRRPVSPRRRAFPPERRPSDARAGSAAACRARRRRHRSRAASDTRRSRRSGDRKQHRSSIPPSRLASSGPGSVQADPRRHRPWRRAGHRGSAASAWLAAPVPRSPQPTSPTRSRSLPAACTAGTPASVPATTVDCRNSRREVDLGRMTDPLISSADVTRTCARTARNPRIAAGSCRPRETRRGTR